MVQWDESQFGPGGLGLILHWLSASLPNVPLSPPGELSSSSELPARPPLPLIISFCRTLQRSPWAEALVSS